MATAAIAYWTAGGGGTGTATTGTTQALVVNQTGPDLNAMYPGDSPQSITGNFDNPNPGPIYVDDVIVTVDSVTPAVGAVGTCESDDYTIAGGTVQINGEVPTGNARRAFSGTTIQFNNEVAENQDGCKGATVNLKFTIA